MRKIVIFVLVFLFCFQGSLLSNGESEQKSNAKYGLYSHYGINTHSADFYKLKGIPNCCPQFEIGTGLGFDLGILYERKLSEVFWFGGRLGITTLDGELIREEETTIILDSGFTDGIFEHKLSGDFLNIGVEPSIIFNPFGELLISFGARLGANINQKYDQIEKIVSPKGVGTFIDSTGNDSHSRKRNEFSGDIPNSAPFQIGLIGGVSYELPLNSQGSFILAPEVTYYFPLVELVENTNWKVNSLRGGIAIKYRPVFKPSKEKKFRKEKFIDTVEIETDEVAESRIVQGKGDISSETIETETEIIESKILKRTDTLLTPKRYKLRGSIVAVGVDSIGEEIPNPIFTIEEYVSNRLDPLLNYVFFANNSSELPDRYNLLSQAETKRFEIDSLFRESTIDIYYNILNIVGKRMTEYPTANLTLVGCNSGVGEEKNDRDLSRKRAEEVKDYLVNVWKISSDRINLQNRNLPNKASTPIREDDKIAENRRVEIYSDSYNITKPVFIEKIDRWASPPIARFKAEAKAEAGLKSWEITAYQSTAPYDRFVKRGGKSLPDKVDWKLEKFQKITPKFPKKIIYNLKLEDKKGNQRTITNKTLPIKVITVRQKRREKIGDYEIERFSLILFDFDKARILGKNKKIVDFIKSRIKPESEIEISGFTDRTGSSDYNKRLSERRAKSAKKAFNRPDATARGIGEERLLYENELPEGRFYCRTVKIVVKTKVN